MVKQLKISAVTTEEWCLVNTRIMEVVVGHNPAVYKDYMAYTIKVCELFRCYECVSVLQYDYGQSTKLRTHVLHAAPIDRYGSR